MKTTLNLLLLVCLVGCSQSPQRVSFDETAQAASKVLCYVGTGFLCRDTRTS